MTNNATVRPTKSVMRVLTHRGGRMLSKFRHEVHFLILFLVLGMLFDSLICEEVKVNCLGNLAGGFLHRLP